MHTDSNRIVHWLISALFTAAWAALVLFCIRNRDRITLDGILSLSPGNSFLAALMMLALFALKSVTIVVWGAMLYVASAMLFTMPVDRPPVPGLPSLELPGSSVEIRPMVTDYSQFE